MCLSLVTGWIVAGHSLRRLVAGLVLLLRAVRSASGKTGRVAGDAAS